MLKNKSWVENPITVQTMTNTLTTDQKSTIEQN